MGNHIQNLTDEEIAKLKEPTDERGSMVAHAMAQNGHIFSVNDLNAIGHWMNCNGHPVSHIMARKGYQFSVYDLLELGNPYDAYGFSLAHKMARDGHVFTVDELIMLGNRTDKSGNSMAEYMTMHKNYKFSLDELARLGVEDGHLLFYLRIYGLHLDKAEMKNLRAKIKREKYTEAERGDMVLRFYQDEECRQAVAAGQQPPVEILMERPDLLMEYGGVV